MMRRMAVALLANLKTYFGPEYVRVGFQEYERRYKIRF